MKRIVAFMALGLVALACAFVERVPAGEERRYIGSSKCKECHEEIYKVFSANARKAHSFSSIQRMAEQLTEEEIVKCYYCHTTGYGHPGGFVSLEKTGDLANVGCESCHGPGSEHVASGGDSDAIAGKGKISMKETCEKCHNPKRIENFGYRPVIHAGAH